MTALRVLDTGLRPAAENIAFNRALFESHQCGESPPTLRFLRFEPCVLVGFHQSVAQEIDEDYCREHGITIQRRITGGGAIYFDPGQIGWELYADRRLFGGAAMDHMARAICDTVAEAIRSYGVDARFRPRNDIEVGGRKISGTGGIVDGDSVLYQGTLLIDFDVERMVSALRIPVQKLRDKAVQSARERVTTLRALTGRAPDHREVQVRLAEAFARRFKVELESAEAPLPEEQARWRAALAQIDTPEWIYQHNAPRVRAPLVEGLYRCPGGTLRAVLAIDPARGLIKQACITGDFFVQPARIVPDLEAALRDVAFEDVAAVVERFFAEHLVDAVQLTPRDWIAAIEQALAAQAPARTGS